jgi:glutamate-1-semialdehyde 2,1-aminomutase
LEVRGLIVSRNGLIGRTYDNRAGCVEFTSIHAQKKAKSERREMAATTTPMPRTVTSFTASDAHRARVHGVIVGGAHTYSKGDDQFPRLAPAAIVRGKGGRVWDPDGNEYVDVTLGLGSVSLGHAYDPVLAAVRAELENGVNFQRPSTLELELGERFLALTPGHDRIKYAKNGSNVTTAAVKLARAYTGRPRVAFPLSHPFFSFDDWYIGATVIDAGCPDPVKWLSVRYDARDPATLEALFEQHPGEIACVITEPQELTDHDPGIYSEAGCIARRHGALFIVDEMLSGLRAGLPGTYPKLGLEPDMATWGKATANGFSFCALTGRREVMELGGIRQTGRPRVFLLSSTHGGETHSLAAAIATLDAYAKQDVIGRLHAHVARVAKAAKASIASAGLDDYIEPHIADWRIVFVFRDKARSISSEMRTLMLQEMIGRGVLYQGVFLSCFAHTDADIEHVIAAFDASCAVYRQAIDHGIGNLLVGEPARPVFRKYVGCRMPCPARPCPHEPACRKG